MKDHAFSLVEVMVVIAVMGVLAGLGLPRITGAMESQKAGIALEQMKQIASAIEIISVNNKRYSFCAAVEDCDTTDEINNALGLDIHNNDFTFTVEWSGIWIIKAIRQNGPDYTLEYRIQADGPHVAYVPDDSGSSGTSGCDAADYEDLITRLLEEGMI